MRKLIAIIICLVLLLMGLVKLVQAVEAFGESIQTDTELISELRGH